MYERKTEDETDRERWGQTLEEAVPILENFKKGRILETTVSESASPPDNIVYMLLRGSL